MVKYYSHRPFARISAARGVFEKPDTRAIESFFSDAEKKQHYYFNYGRSALVFAFRELGLKRKQVLIPAFICPFFSSLIKNTGIRSGYVDVDLDTFNVDLQELQKKITKQTTAVLVSHNFGNPLDTKFLRDLKEDKGIVLIEDCAHALLAYDHKTRAGSIGDLALFSMYKETPAPKGAVLASDDGFPSYKKLSRESLSPREIGRFVSSIIPSVQPILSASGPYRISEERLYSIARCPEIALKIFSEQTKTHQSNLNKKNIIALQIRKGISEIEGVQIQDIGKMKRPGWMNIALAVASKRKIAIERMKKKGIVCLTMWKTLPTDSCLRANKLSKSIINLPIQPDYGESDIEYIISSLEKAVK